MFELFTYPFVGTMITLHDRNNDVIEGYARGEVYVRPHITDFFLVLKLVEREVLEFTIPFGEKKWILLAQSHQ